MAKFHKLPPDAHYDIIDGGSGHWRTQGIEGGAAMEAVWHLGDEAWPAGETEFKGKPVDVAARAYVPHNKQFSSMHETSSVVVEAIFELATEGDEERLWLQPTIEEVEAVLARAWALADPDDEVLHWGVESYYKFDYHPPT